MKRVFFIAVIVICLSGGLSNATPIQIDDTNWNYSSMDNVDYHSVSNEKPGGVLTYSNVAQNIGASFNYQEGFSSLNDFCVRVSYSDYRYKRLEDWGMFASTGLRLFSNTNGVVKAQISLY